MSIRNISKKGFAAHLLGRILALSEVNERSKLAFEDLQIQKEQEILALVERVDNVSKKSRQNGGLAKIFTAIYNESSKAGLLP
ncbi:hypothetical protein [Alteromonas oceanisediminis]|uniref:hypothetical protein n=1 Tax=Alteromonas oceanisediminis TaxID=2836180 RepID=UPI001BD9526C|nr:hypothetical protein [Alteromonas oceanisediminis]MBT0587028.1 hypothetical protein [Alteromonas oceanisediminis]